MSKSYKALRIMEVHKTAQPKFARTLKNLHPYLQSLKNTQLTSSTDDPALKWGQDLDNTDDEDDLFKTENVNSLMGMPPIMTPEAGDLIDLSSIMKGSDVIDQKLDGTCSLSKVVFNDSTFSSAHAISPKQVVKKKIMQLTSDGREKFTAVPLMMKRNDFSVDFKTETDSTNSKVPHQQNMYRNNNHTKNATL